MWTSKDVRITEAKTNTHIVGWAAPIARSPPKKKSSGHETGNDDIDNRNGDTYGGESRFDQNFKVIKELGQGSFGTVYLTTEMKSGKNYAIKLINIDDYTTEEDAANESYIHSQLRHLNIIQFYKSWIERSVYWIKFYISMEFCPNGTLREAIKDGIYFERRWFLGKQLVEALNYMHERGFAHCDLKTDNILIEHQDRLKICDFGNAEKLKPSAQSPEDQGIVYTGYCARLVKDDIKDLGKVFYELCYGPFNTEHHLMESINDFRQKSIPPRSENTEDTFPPQDQLLQLLIEGDFDRLSKPRQEKASDSDEDLTESMKSLGLESTGDREPRDRINPSIKSPGEKSSEAGLGAHFGLYFILVLVVFIMICYVKSTSISVLHIITRVLDAITWNRQYQMAYLEILKMTGRVT